jgi:maltooligosyltrehalose trehalohydrolase
VISANWHPSFGANLIERKRTRFRIWAPAQKMMSVAIEAGQRVAMKPTGDGWFEAEAACGAGTRYQFLLADGITIPDPASRGQDSDVHGDSVVVDPAAYKWRHPDWVGRPWHETVLYELHAGLLGGYAGVMRELPRLAGLGVTAIELMPIAEFPGARNWGYDGTLPYAPERGYGAPDELRALIDAAHGYGLMVFLDVVYNHFGPDGNYLPLLAPEMFRADVSTPWGPAIDFRRPQVRRFFTENALYWLLDYRFDGLRFDAVHAITEPDWLHEMAVEVRLAVKRGRCVHLVLENDRNDAAYLTRNFDAQWNDDAHHVLHVLLTGEHEGYYEDYADRPAERLARCLSEGFAYQGEPSPHRGGKQRGSASAVLPPTAFVLFLQNHDQIGNRAFGERLTTLADPRALEAATALQLLAPQIPLIFMGEEMASKAPFLFFTDHNPELAKAVREGRKAEFSTFSQFSDPALIARLADPNAHDSFDRSKPNPAAECATARALFYHELLKIRRDEIVPRLPNTRALDARALGTAAVVARWQMGDGSLLTVACNIGQSSVGMPSLSGRPLFATSQAARKQASFGQLSDRSTVVALDFK